MMRRIAVAVAAIVLWSVSAQAEDMDVRALAAKLAAQEARMSDQDARMRDLEAKLYCQDGTGPAESITSLRKNATVTIGGLVTTGVYVNKGVVETPLRSIKQEYKLTSMELSDAELYAQIDVNEHFDAFLSMDLHSVGNDAAEQYGVAKSYYVRWKNICNTGFGLKVGRDDAAFGDPDNQAGYLDSWAAGTGDGYGRVQDLLLDGKGGSANSFTNGWKYEGITQVTPYWEGLDGALKVELSLFQNAWFGDDGYMNGTTLGSTAYYFDKHNGTHKYTSRNLGLGSGSLRAQYSPIENLTLTASVINFHARSYISDGSWGPAYGEFGQATTGLEGPHASNNTAVNLAFRYTPCWFDKLTVWGQYVHGWNVENVKDMDSDVVNFGASFALTDQLSVFAQGDYTYSKDGNNKGNGQGWAWYGGVSYEFPMGVILEAGWRHETYRWKYAENTGYGGMPVPGGTHVKGRHNTIYANLGFEF